MPRAAEQKLTALIWVWVGVSNTAQLECRLYITGAHDAPLVPEGTMSETRKIIAALLACICLALPLQASASGDYTRDFLDKAFGKQNPTPQLLWLDKALKAQAEAILKHDFRGLRVRYWIADSRTVWILDEIGKELPISIGVVIADDKIQDISVLAFRESRGGEIRYPFFTNQFLGSQLNEELTLNQNIDGITGATLSVRAMTRIATLALLFHNQVTATEPDET